MLLRSGTPYKNLCRSASVSHAELDESNNLEYEFNYLKLSYYKVGQPLLQTAASITNCGKYYYKVGQLRVITKQGKSYYKLRQVIYQQLLLQLLLAIYMGQLLLQSWTGITKQGNLITKWVRYYKVGQSLQSRTVHYWITM